MWAQPPMSSAPPASPAQGPSPPCPSGRPRVQVWARLWRWLELAQGLWGEAAAQFQLERVGREVRNSYSVLLS